MSVLEPIPPKILSVRRIPAAGRLHFLHKLADDGRVLVEIETLGDVGGSGIAVIAVGDDADPNTGTVSRDATTVMWNFLRYFRRNRILQNRKGERTSRPMFR